MESSPLIPSETTINQLYFLYSNWSESFMIYTECYIHLPNGYHFCTAPFVLHCMYCSVAVGDVSVTLASCRKHPASVYSLLYRCCSPGQWFCVSVGTITATRAGVWVNNELF